MNCEPLVGLEKNERLAFPGLGKWIGNAVLVVLENKYFATPEGNRIKVIIQYVFKPGNDCTNGVDIKECPANVTSKGSISARLGKVMDGLILGPCCSGNLPAKFGHNEMQSASFWAISRGPKNQPFHIPRECPSKGNRQ